MANVKRMIDSTTSKTRVTTTPPRDETRPFSITGKDRGGDKSSK